MYAKLLRHLSKPRNTRRTKRTLGFDNLEGRQLLSLGVEFPINSITSAAENTPVTASSRNGSSIAVWEHAFGTGTDLQAQRFNALGAKVGPQLFIAGKVGVNMSQPSVAMDAHGDFVVSWTQSPGSGGTDVFAQKFNANGVAINGLVPVGVGTFAETQPSVAMDARGDFVVAYTRNTNNTTNVFAKVYNANSQRLSVTPVGGTEFVEDAPSVAMAPNGLFDVTYQIHPTKSTVDVFANRYAFNGSLLGEFSIAAGAPSPGVPSIAMDNLGNAVVAYDQSDTNHQDIFARRLSNKGAVGGVITVVGPVNVQGPSVALEGNGGTFVVAYQNLGSGITEVNASNHVVSTQTVGSRFFPHVSINGQNKYLLVYMTSAPGAVTNIAGRFGLL